MLLLINNRSWFFLLLLLWCCLGFIIIELNAQTTEEVGYPDPHYSTKKNISKFSCTGGFKNCPDGGEYKAAGGNLTLTVIEMKNLPDLDGFGLAGLETDAYVEARIGDNVRYSGEIKNSLNPKWRPCIEKGCTGPEDIKRDLNFGFRPAGTQITLNVWDKDYGFEFGDDLIASITIHAIYCSAFTAKVQTIENDDDTVWKIPKQPLCVEEMWLPLVGDAPTGACQDPENIETPCLRLRMTSLPFQIRSEETFIKNITVTGGMGGFFPDTFPSIYGRVYSTSTNMRMASYFRMERSKGGLIVRPDMTSNNLKGNQRLIEKFGYPPYARITMNYDAELFIFRRVTDELSTPEWLNQSIIDETHQTNAFGWKLTREYAQLINVADDFRAFAQNFSKHEINRYGDALDHGIILGTNLPQNYRDFTLSMYFGVLIPHESFDLIPIEYSKEFSRGMFLLLCLQFGPCFVFLMVLVIKYLQKMNWRIERVASFLAEKIIIMNEQQSSKMMTSSSSSSPTLTSTSTSTSTSTPTPTPTHVPLALEKPIVDIVSILFLTYQQSEKNVDFRHNLFYACIAVKICMVAPIFMLISFGITCISLVTPPALGFGLIFLGIASGMGTYAFIRWKKSGWRMTTKILFLLLACFCFSFIFLLASTFADPRVFYGQEKVDFFSLTAVFFTMNMMPLIWICFTNDSKLMKSLKQVIAVVSASKKVATLKEKFNKIGALGLKLALGGNGYGTGNTNVNTRKKDRKKSVFDPLMGEHYSVEKSIPGLDRADILQSPFVTPKETQAKNNRRYYTLSIVILCIYCIIAFARSEFPSQSIGLSITVVFTDVCLYMLSRGFIHWSAGYQVFLMSACRTCLVATSGRYWILGHAFMYMVLGAALCREIIGKNLPRMSKQEAGGVTFFGHDQQQWRHYDLSTTPEFVLGFLSFFYIFLLLAVAFGTDTNDTIQVEIFGQEWPLWVFGVLAFIVVLFSGLTAATSRAFFLQKEYLLSEYAMQMYLFLKPLQLPFILAMGSEILVICSGLFVFAATKSSFILVLSIFGPMILLLTLVVYVQWRKNDYRLVIWPPEEDEDILEEEDDEEQDEEQILAIQFEKQAEIMREQFVLPPLRHGNKSTKNNTTIIMKNGKEEEEEEEKKQFRMPSLPPKGSLQARVIQGLKKNQQLQHETKETKETKETQNVTKRKQQQKPTTLVSIPSKNSLNKSNTADHQGELDQVEKELVNRTTTTTTTTPPLDQADALEKGMMVVVDNAKNIKQPKPSSVGERLGLFGRFKRLLGGKVPWKKYEKVAMVEDVTSSLNPSSPSPSLPLPATSSSTTNSTTPLLGDTQLMDQVNFDQMSLYQAFRQGYLLPQDYVTLGCFGFLLFLLFVFGIVLSGTETPKWMGNLIWILLYIFLFTMSPTYKYFCIGGGNELTKDMRFSYGFAFLFAWISGILFFVQVMKNNVNEVESLMILTFLIMYPILLLLSATLWKLRENQWLLTKDLKIVLTGCYLMLLLFIFECFFFLDVFFGSILLFITSLVTFCGYFFMKYIANDHYLAPKDARRASLLLLTATCLAIGMGIFFGLNFFYCFSIGICVLILKNMITLVAFFMTKQEDMEFFFSPYIFPVFSYNAYTNNVVEEDEIVKKLYVIFGLCFTWGVAGVLFIDPLGFGIGLCSIVLLAFAGTTCHLCSITPVKMGIAAKYVNEMILKESSAAAKQVFEQRRKQFRLECQEFVDLERKEKKAELEYQAIAYGRLKGNNKAAGVSGFAMNGPQSLKKTRQEQIELLLVEEEQAAIEAEKNSRKSAGALAMELDDLKWKCRYEISPENGQQVRLDDALFTWVDAKNEIVQTGRGPFGFLQIFALISDQVAKYIDRIRVKLRLPAKSDGNTVATVNNNSSNAAFSTKESIAETTKRLPPASPLALHLKKFQPAQNSTIGGEGDTEKKRKQTDLVGFLLEIPLVDEELDKQFYEETRCIIHFQLLMLNAADARLSREKILFQKFLRENRFKLMSNGINPPANIFKTSSFASIDIPLVAVWLLSLTPEERARFHGLKAAFNEEMERTDAIIDAEDQQSKQAQQELRDFWKTREDEQCKKRVQEFQARRMRREEEGIEQLDRDEATSNALETIMEIESGYACVPGEYGRALQYIDREFPPDASSVSNCSHEHDILEWRVSTAINVVAGLFDGGTDPDDVRIGKLNDSWLLSALSIIAASGGLDDGKVDPLIDKIFITKQTSLTGAYAIRLFKNCQWETVVVDDFFPVLEDSHQAEPCAGAAFAHSKGFQELWVPLIEKAYAKYHGGYAALERGYVHHALKELTSYDSEEIFLAQASRGTLKKTLWKQLLKFKANKFLMGAGTITSDNADNEILDTGLVFGACYVIYDVREIDGYQLLKLRNPPGDHAEWRGDWSDDSKLWTRRLKKILGWNADAEDNTFWMNFDDFCNSFRSLYVCRYYDPVKWPLVTFHGFWRGDTGQGLPTHHNPECVVTNNPQFSLAIDRPTEVMITLTQVDAAGLAPLQVLPVAIYVVWTNKKKDRTQRVKILDKEHVVAHSGEPVREREIKVHCELPARTYTVLVAAYKKGMEGPFRVTIQTNYPVKVEQLWPAVWKDPSKQTLAEKMASRVKETVAESSTMAKVMEKKNEMMTKLNAGVNIMNDVMKDEETILKEELEKKRKKKEEQEEALAAAAIAAKKNAKKPSGWVEEWDEAAGKPFYYNKQTGLSSWTKPADF